MSTLPAPLKVVSALSFYTLNKVCRTLPTSYIVRTNTQLIGMHEQADYNEIKKSVTAVTVNLITI